MAQHALVLKRGITITYGPAIASTIITSLLFWNEERTTEIQCLYVPSYRSGLRLTKPSLFALLAMGEFDIGAEVVPVPSLLVLELPRQISKGKFETTFAQRFGCRNISNFSTERRLVNT